MSSLRWNGLNVRRYIYCHAQRIFVVLLSPDCGDLARPTNGDVSYTDTIVNSRAANTCTDGFRLSGSVERICDRSSTPAK
ncbi:hypothetical protein DPMN_051707 [Dreissena polymorpha]|uniref:Sushi domain-containing protein n=1 Tax=Dreissena polymorpha TaxID=45954 RepID=A0A9D4CKH2_DREPO|nr:hypothetical protein DPMN_051707 [Dreissena polymorpha]